MQSDSGGGTMDPVTRFAGPLVRFASILCGWWLLGYCFLVVLDIVGRQLRCERQVMPHRRQPQVERPTG